MRSNPKAMKRLSKEAVKIKEVLSANKQNQIKISELQDYVTLMTVIERKEFEDKAAALFERVMDPVRQVLTQAGVSID